jgi:hypothetical protein
MAKKFIINQFNAADLVIQGYEHSKSGKKNAG